MSLEIRVLFYLVVQVMVVVVHGKQSSFVAWKDAGIGAMAATN